MRTNNIITNMKVGKISYGCQLNFPSTDLVELIGMAGFDFVYIDGEHGPFSAQHLDDLCRVADMNGLTTIARTPNIEPSTILMYLERGVTGIIGPHITTKEDAQQLASACFFGPLGDRSLGTSRGAYYGSYSSDREYMEHANSQTLAFALMEDIRILDDLDGIISVDGIEVFGVGEKDIAQSMGLPGQSTHPKVLEIRAQVATVVHAAGKKMDADVLIATRSTKLFLDAARAFLQANRG